MAGHQRSTSLPSILHPNEIKVEEELHSINSSISSPSATIEMVCDGLRRLGDVYNCINEIISLHSNQVHGKRLEDEMERSLEVLDLCNAMQESFTDLKMTIQELKKAGNKSASDEDGRLVSLLTAARGISVSVVKSALELLSKQMATCNASKWSLISKSFQKTKVSCEELQLQALELGIVGLESGIENLFRRSIQTRVSLLNTLSS